MSLWSRVELHADALIREEHPTPRDSKHDELDGLFVV